MNIDAVAIEDALILFIKLNKLLHTCKNPCEFHTQLIRNLMDVLACKNLILNRKLEHVTQRTTREKILSYLSEQSQIADYLSADRSAMSNELSKLQNEGIIIYNKNKFYLY